MRPRPGASTPRRNAEMRTGCPHARRRRNRSAPQPAPRGSRRRHGKDLTWCDGGVDAGLARVGGSHGAQAAKQRDVHAEHLGRVPAPSRTGGVLRPVREAGGAVGGALGTVDVGDIVLVAEIDDGGCERSRPVRSGATPRPRSSHSSRAGAGGIQVDQAGRHRSPRSPRRRGHEEHISGEPSLGSPAAFRGRRSRSPSHSATRRIRPSAGASASDHLACRTHVESNGGQQHQHDQGQQREQPQHGHQNKPAVILTKTPRIAPRPGALVLPRRSPPLDGDGDQ